MKRWLIFILLLCSAVLNGHPPSLYRYTEASGALELHEAVERSLLAQRPSLSPDIIEILKKLEIKSINEAFLAP